MPRNIMSVLRVKNWHGGWADESSSNSNSDGDESDDQTKMIQNLRKFSASDMVRIAETRMWPSSSDDEDDEEEEEVKSIRKSSSSEENDQTHHTEQNLTVNHSNEKREEDKPEVKAKQESCIIQFSDSEPSSEKKEATKNLTAAAAEGEAESDPRGFSRNRRRSSVFGLLMGRRVSKASNELSLDAQIAQLEKRIAKKMKRLDELQLKLQEMKNLNTN